MNTVASRSVSRPTITIILIVVPLIVGWIMFVHWLIKYQTVKHYKRVVEICRTSTSAPHYCPPLDAPILDSKAFSNTLQSDIQAYTKEQIRKSLPATSTRK